MHVGPLLDQALVTSGELRLKARAACQGVCSAMRGYFKIAARLDESRAAERRRRAAAHM